jgi:hypothetical protein
MRGRFQVGKTVDVASLLYKQIIMARANADICPVYG